MNLKKEWSSWALVNTIGLYLLIAPIFAALGVVEISWRGASLYDWQRYFEWLAISIAVAILCFELLARPAEYDSPPLALCLAGFFLVIGITSIFLGPDARWASWRQLLLYSELVLLVWGARHIIQQQRQVTEFFRLYLFASGLVYVAWIVIHNNDLNIWTLPYEVFEFPGFVNIRGFSDWQAFLMPLLPVMVTHYCLKYWVRILAWVFVATFYALLYATGARSVLFGHGFAYVVMLLILGRLYLPVLRRTVSYWAGGIAIFGLAKYCVLPQQVGFTLGMGAGRGWDSLTHTSDRVFLWQRAIELANQSPFFGVGPGRFPLYPNGMASAPHNAFLNFAAEWGWPTAVVLSALTLLFFYDHLKVLRRMPKVAVLSSLNRSDDVHVGFLTALLALFFQSLVSTHVILGPVLQVCIVVALICLPNTPSIHTSWKTSSRVLWPLMTFVTIVLGWMILTDFSEMAVTNSRYFDCHRPYPTFFPHFWSQGWLFDTCESF